MNLRVDLIMESEQRSANVLNVKSLIRISILAVPAIIIGTILVSSINVMHTKIRLKNLTDKWEIAEKRQAEARGMNNDKALRNNIKTEILGWKNTHIDWHTQLLALQRMASLNMQFTRLNISQKIELINKKNPGRFFILDLKGIAVGADAETNVQSFIANIREMEVFSTEMDDVIINNFGESSEKGASKHDREFSIQCVYKQKEFVEPRK